jgi:hypothetical protein
LSACNSSDDLETARKDIANKVPAFVAKLTGGGMLVESCKLYELDEITEKEAVEFRIRALSDSLIIQKRLDEHFNNLITKKMADMKSMDSAKMNTDAVKAMIQRYLGKVDSNKMNTVNTRRMLDSFNAVTGRDASEKNYYKAMFSICTFNLTSSTSCDSFAFLLNKKREILSMHLKNKL